VNRARTIIGPKLREDFLGRIDVAHAVPHLPIGKAIVFDTPSGARQIVYAEPQLGSRPSHLLIPH
jgi:hypothetical protein